ncbi:MAG: hypothetical protein GF353_10750 [Candidatus Lokiarchaeota archaeon]|nr:hypothetical protein [Candidatus Lokiarchaeota archaeon]
MFSQLGKLRVGAVVIFVMVHAFLLNSNSCEGKPNPVIKLGTIDLNNLSSGQASQIKAQIKSIVSNYNNDKKYAKEVSGLVSRVDQIYVVTITSKNLNGSNKKQVTKNYKGDFSGFLKSSKIREAVIAAIEK